MNPLSLEQYPPSSSRLVRRAGDLLKVTLRLNRPAQGDAYVRTNLGKAAVHRRELLRRFEQGTALAGRDWHDRRMRRLDDRHFELLLPLWETGYFEFKCYFVPEASGQGLWVRGENARVKIEPAFTLACNTIYNAFIRQFGPNCRARVQTAEQAAAARLLDEADYSVIPPSGTYADFAAHLDFIMGQMGFRIIQFLPVHPTPTTYARMGRFGSRSFAIW